MQLKFTARLVRAIIQSSYDTKVPVIVFSSLIVRWPGLDGKGAPTPATHIIRSCALLDPCAI